MTLNSRYLAIAFACVSASACSGGGSSPAPSPSPAPTPTPVPTPAPSASDTLTFSGHLWHVRSGGGGPGPNNWDTQNAWVDTSGYLHLKIAHRNGVWSCAEIYTDDTLGFGTYQFKIIGRPDTLDDNIVLGLFNYPTPDIGPDGTNEIDIEFATWGGAQPYHGNWTVWPAITGTQTTHGYDATLTGNTSTHRFDWRSTRIAFQSMNGLVDDNAGEYANWTFSPGNPARDIPQNAMPLHMNFWLFQGQAPTGGQEAEIVISEFKFTP